MFQLVYVNMIDIHKEILDHRELTYSIYHRYLEFMEKIKLVKHDSSETTFTEQLSFEHVSKTRENQTL